MSVDQLRLWGNNVYSRVKEASLPCVYEHVHLSIPRSTYRKCAMSFNDIRSMNTSKAYQLMLQTFLEMIHRTYDWHLQNRHKTKVTVFPFLKVYLEFPSSSSRDDESSCYRIHAFALHEAIHFGSALEDIIKENAQRQRESRTNKRAARINPLENLADYQLFYRMTSKEMYVRCIADFLHQGNAFMCGLDQIMGTSLDHVDNIGNPTSVFDLKTCLSNSPTNTLDVFTKTDSYCVDNQWLFPSYGHLLRLSPEQFNTAVFINKYLPDYQRRMEAYYTPDIIHRPTLDNYVNTDQLTESFALDKMDVSIIDKAPLSEYDLRMTKDVERSKFDEFYERSDFVIMQKRAKEEYQRNVRPFEKTKLFAEKYRAYQKWTCEEFEARCLDEDSNISDVGLNIIYWANKHGHKTFHTYRIFDNTMSIFANMIIRKMEDYEEFLQISTNHLDYMKIMFGRLDAYRRSFKLHFNMFLTGEGATSKSFLFDLMKASSIPGTVDTLTYQTTKADAVDGNRNDLITVCHEAPPGMFNTSKNKNMDRSQETMFKEKLTSCTVSCKTIVIDDTTGKRCNRITKSECIGVWFGATNDDPSDVEQALKTRFFWGGFERCARTGKDIDDCKSAEDQLSVLDHEKINRIQLSEQAEQYRYYVVEKAIHVGLIRDVEMTAFTLVMKVFKKKIKSVSFHNISPRDTDRVKILARIMCILTAIHTVMNLPGGAGYQQPFQVKHVIDMEPLLIVTEEQVRFAIILLDSQYVGPAEHKILRKIYDLNKNKPEYTARIATSEGNDPNYLKLDKLSDLVKNIQSNLSTKDGQTSKNNIRSFLIDLTDQSRYTHPYILPDTHEKTGWAVQNKNGSSKHFQLAFVTQDAVYLHMSLFEQFKSSEEDIDYDPVMDVLQKISHKHCSVKKTITARHELDDNNEKNWKKLKTMTLKPFGNVMKVKNLLYSSNASRLITATQHHTDNRMKDQIIIQKDFDEYARYKRKDKLGYYIPSIQSYQHYSWKQHTQQQRDTVIEYELLHRKKTKDNDNVPQPEIVVDQETLKKQDKKDEEAYFESHKRKRHPTEPIQHNNQRNNTIY